MALLGLHLLASIGFALASPWGVWHFLQVLGYPVVLPLEVWTASEGDNPMKAIWTPLHTAVAMIGAALLAAIILHWMAPARISRWTDGYVGAPASVIWISGALWASYWMVVHS